MDEREDLPNKQAADASPDMRERLRASIARQADSIRRAAANRSRDGAPRWPDRGPREAAFREAAQAWEREALLPRRGWEPDLPDPPFEEDPTEFDARRSGHGHPSEGRSRLALIRGWLSAWLSALLPQKSSGPTQGASEAGATGARLAPTRVPRSNADTASLAGRHDEAAGGGSHGGDVPFDPIGDFGARILEELLDKDGGPRNERGRRR